MVREYHWQLQVRSYEGDAWGLLPASGMMRYLEEAAVSAARDVGYGRAFHDERNSLWVIRRMALALHAPVHIGDCIDITTWASHFERVRGGREYRVTNADDTLVASGLAEWVYLERKTLRPLAVPREVAVDFDLPGAPLGDYTPPSLSPVGQQFAFRAERVAEWHECDSLQHINNSVYVDWLDDALRTGLAELGWGVERLRERDLQLRGEHLKLDYKRAALPDHRLVISTTVQASEGRLVSVQQSIVSDEGAEVLTAHSVYGWQDSEGQPSQAPDILLA